MSQVRDFNTEVSVGNIPNFDHFTVFGRIASVDIESADLWDPGGDIVLPTGSTITVESDNANDAFGGTGATLIQIIGLDENDDMQTEVAVVMAGLTPVATSGSWNAIFRAFPVGWGVTNENIGTITLKDGANTVSQINPSSNGTQNGYYIVPAGKNGYIKYAVANCIPGAQAVGIKEGEIELRLKFAGTTGFIRSGSSPLSSRSGQVTLSLDLPTQIPPLTMVKMRYNSHNKNVKVTGAMQILTEDA